MSDSIVLDTLQALSHFKGNILSTSLANMQKGRDADDQIQFLKMTMRAAEPQINALYETIEKTGFKQSKETSTQEVIKIVKLINQNITKLEELISKNERQSFFHCLCQIIFGHQWKFLTQEATQNVQLLLLVLSREDRDSATIKECHDHLNELNPTQLRRNIMKTLSDRINDTNELSASIIVQEVENYISATNLNKAVDQRNLEAVQKIMRKNSKRINSVNRKNQTPLISALTNSPLMETIPEDVEFKIVHTLLTNSANPNIGELDGTSPLHRAIRNRKPINIIKDLIDYGADVMALTSHGEAPIHFACKDNADLAIVQLLVDKDRRCVNIEDNDHQTPLFQAVKHKNLEIMKFLIEMSGHENLDERAVRKIFFEVGNIFKKDIKRKVMDVLLEVFPGQIVDFDLMTDY